MQEIEYVEKLLKEDNYSLLSNDITVGPVYLIKGYGNAQSDGFTVDYLFIPKGSSLKKHVCESYVEKTTTLIGTKNDSITPIGATSWDKGAYLDTILRYSRIAKGYVPGMYDLTDSELEEMFYHIENEAKEVKYHIKDVFYIPFGRGKGSLAYAVRATDEQGKETNRSYYYDIFTDEFISAYTLETSKGFIPLDKMVNDMHYNLNYRHLTKDEIKSLWESIKEEVVNYNEDPKNPGRYVYEPYQVTFKGADGIDRIRISNLYLVKDMNIETRLCMYGPNNTFRDFFDPNKKEEENYPLGWRADEDRIFRLNEVIRAFGGNPPELCTFDEVCALFEEAKFMLRDLTFNDEDSRLWSPYFNNYTYEDIAR